MFYLSWTEKYFGVLGSPQVSAAAVVVVVASSLITQVVREAKRWLQHKKPSRGVNICYVTKTCAANVFPSPSVNTNCHLN